MIVEQFSLTSSSSRHEFATPQHCYRVETLADVRLAVAAVRARGERVRVVGQWTSASNDGPSSFENQIVTTALNSIVVDARRRRVVVGGGARVVDVLGRLRRERMRLAGGVTTLRNESVAGALGVGQCAALERSVRRLTFLTADGKLVNFTDDDDNDDGGGDKAVSGTVDDASSEAAAAAPAAAAARRRRRFRASLVHLGVLGVVVEVELSVRSIDDDEMTVHEADANSVVAGSNASFPSSLSLDELLARMPTLPTSVEAHWIPHTSCVRVLPLTEGGARVGSGSGVASAAMAACRRALAWLLTISYALLPTLFDSVARVVVVIINGLYAWLTAIFGVVDVDDMPRYRLFEWSLPLARAPEALKALQAAIAATNLIVFAPIVLRRRRGGADLSNLSPSGCGDTLMLTAYVYRLNGAYPRWTTRLEQLLSAPMLEHFARPSWRTDTICTQRALASTYGDAYRELVRLRDELDEERLFENNFTLRTMPP